VALVVASMEWNQKQKEHRGRAASRTAGEEERGPETTDTSRGELRGVDRLGG